MLAPLISCATSPSNLAGTHSTGRKTGSIYQSCPYGAEEEKKLTVNKLGLLVKHRLAGDKVAVKPGANAQGKLDEGDVVLEVLGVDNDEFGELRVESVDEADDKPVALRRTRRSSCVSFDASAVGPSGKGGRGRTDEAGLSKRSTWTCPVVVDFSGVVVQASEAVEAGEKAPTRAFPVEDASVVDRRKEGELVRKTLEAVVDPGKFT